MPKKSAYCCVLMAAILWGGLGIYSRVLAPLGFSPIQIVALRAWGAAIFLLVGVSLWQPSALKIRWRHLPYFLGTGLLSFVFFNICYFTAIELTSLAVAAILLYTSPIIVMVLSVLLLGERFSLRKGLALLLAFSGCCLVASAGGWADGQLLGSGLWIGLGAGLGYALYSILGRLALNHYGPLTLTLWTFLIAATAMLFLAELPSTLSLVSQSGMWLWVLALALLGTVAPFALYTLGLQGMESSRAALIACIEPVIAAVVGVLIFQEALNGGLLAGIILVLSGVLILAQSPLMVKGVGES